MADSPSDKAGKTSAGLRRYLRVSGWMLVVLAVLNVLFYGWDGFDIFLAFNVLLAGLCLGYARWETRLYAWRRPLAGVSAFYWLLACFLAWHLVLATFSAVNPPRMPDYVDLAEPKLTPEQKESDREFAQRFLGEKGLLRSEGVYALRGSSFGLGINVNPPSPEEFLRNPELQSSIPDASPILDEYFDFLSTHQVRTAYGRDGHLGPLDLATMELTRIAYLEHDGQREMAYPLYLRYLRACRVNRNAFLINFGAVKQAEFMPDLVTGHEAEVRAEIASCREVIAQSKYTQVSSMVREARKTIQQRWPIRWGESGIAEQPFTLEPGGVLMFMSQYTYNTLGMRFSKWPLYDERASLAAYAQTLDRYMVLDNLPAREVVANYRHELQQSRRFAYGLPGTVRALLTPHVGSSYEYPYARDLDHLAKHRYYDSSLAAYDYLLAWHAGDRPVPPVDAMAQRPFFTEITKAADSREHVFLAGGDAVGFTDLADNRRVLQKRDDLHGKYLYAIRMTRPVQ